MKADNILATIGQTPHIRLSRLFPDHEVWVKSERANPGGSIKDRIALAMISASAAVASGRPKDSSPACANSPGSPARIRNTGPA